MNRANNDNTAARTIRMKAIGAQRAGERMQHRLTDMPECRNMPATTRWRRLFFLALLAGVMTVPSGLAGPSVASAQTATAPKFHLKRPPKDTPADVLAETIIYDHKRDIATALGRVRIIWGPYLLLARKVVYNRRNDRFRAEGEVYLREPEGNILLASVIDLDKRFRDGFARHLRLLMTNGATLKARYAVRREGNITVYTDVRYTACVTCRLKDGTPLWEIRSRQATHNQQKGRIYHRDMTLMFAGSPVFWLPWLSHPDPEHPRSSGFLIPSAGYSKARGAHVTIPYFINLAPSYDITLLPQINHRQGLLARAKWRHNVGPGTYTVDAGGIYQMQRREMPADEQNRLRWFARADGEFALNRDWTWGFSGAVQSDRNMMRRYGVDSRSVIHSRMWLQGLHERNFLFAETGHYRGLNDADDNRRDPFMLPWVEHQFTFSPAVLGGVMGLDTSIYSIWRRSEGLPFAAAPLAERNTRLSSVLHWQREFITDAGMQIQPFMEWRNELRAVSNLPDIINPANRLTSVRLRSMPRAGVDARWPFLGEFEGGYQVLTPVAQVIFASNEYGRRQAGNEDSITPRFSSSHLFLHDRFAGMDRFEGGVRVNAGLTWGLYADNSGFLRATLGQSFHLLGRNSFAGTSVGLGSKRSDIVAGVALAPNEHLLISWRGRFDPQSLKPRDQEAELDLTWRNVKLNLKYAYLVAYPEYGQTNDDKQFSGAVEWRFHDNWRIFGGLNYGIQGASDALNDNWQAKRYIGFGFDCDCFKASITYSEGVSSEGAETTFSRNISLDIEFATLGSTAVRSAGQ